MSPTDWLWAAAAGVLLVSVLGSALWRGFAPRPAPEAMDPASDTIPAPAARGGCLVCGAVATHPIPTDGRRRWAPVGDDLCRLDYDSTHAALRELDAREAGEVQQLRARHARGRAEAVQAIIDGLRAQLAPVRARQASVADLTEGVG